MSRRAESHRQLKAKRKEEKLRAKQGRRVSNATNLKQTKEEAQKERELLTRGTSKVLRKMLPKILKQFSKIPDPRSPQLVKHKLTVVLLYGILLFFLRMKSRREGNRLITQAYFREHLQSLIPELESIPHGDTLYRLLERIDVEQIQETTVNLVRELIRTKVFNRFLLNNKRYQIVIDGTRKHNRDYPWIKEALNRTTSENGEKEYYVYVLEANIVLPNGLRIPLASELLSNENHESEETKQDCELKAFYRLATKIKHWFPRLRVTVSLDGLYALGPVMSLCQKNNWDYMIVLKDNCLPQVWEEFNGLRPFQPENEYTQTHQDRQQRFYWVNDIEYSYGKRGQRVTVHVIVCEETYWEMNPRTEKLEQKTSRHAWISRKPLKVANIDQRCNTVARQRWSIETNIRIEKHNGFQYERSFAESWNAIKGYHYLMRLGHLLNEIVLHLQELESLVYQYTDCGIIELLKKTLDGPWFATSHLRDIAKSRGQIRLVG